MGQSYCPGLILPQGKSLALVLPLQPLPLLSASQSFLGPQGARNCEKSCSRQRRQEVGEMRCWGRGLNLDAHENAN